MNKIFCIPPVGYLDLRSSWHTRASSSRIRVEFKRRLPSSEYHASPCGRTPSVPLPWPTGRMLLPARRKTGLLAPLVSNWKDSKGKALAGRVSRSLSCGTARQPRELQMFRRGSARRLSEDSPEASFRRKPESMDAYVFWMPAFAGMTNGRC